jgi:sigma-E factor negative regulatory protein RseA
MKHEASNPDELVSALVDGELGGQAFAQAIAWLEESDEAQAAWHSYHLVGDVLRSGELAAAGANDRVFLERLRQRLQGETQVTQTEMFVELSGSVGHQNAALDSDPGKGQSANDSGMRWKMVAGFATLTAVAVVGWQAFISIREPSGSPRLARVEVSPSPGQTQVMIRDPRLDQLLAAHQQSGGISALQMPAGFLRDATLVVPAR